MQASRKARKPSLFEWVFAVLIILFGIFLISGDRKPLEENELVLVEGIPTEAKLITVSSLKTENTEIVDFKIAGHHIQYASDDPDFEKVKAILQTAHPVKAWLDTRPVLIPIGGQFDFLYKLQCDTQEILGYQRMRQKRDQSKNAIPIVGWAIILLGVFAMFVSWKNSRDSKK